MDFFNYSVQVSEFPACKARILLLICKILNFLCISSFDIFICQVKQQNADIYYGVLSLKNRIRFQNIFSFRYILKQKHNNDIIKQKTHSLTVKSTSYFLPIFVYTMHSLEKKINITLSSFCILTFERINRSWRTMLTASLEMKIWRQGRHHNVRRHSTHR